MTSDGAHEGDEAFQVKLANAAGGASLGSPAGASVTITDDDAAPAAPGTSDSPASTISAASPSGAVPVRSDQTAPKRTVAAKTVQRALKAKLLALSARCDERCKLVVVAKLRIGKRKVALGRAKVALLSDKTAELKVKLSRKALVKLCKATKHGKAKVVLSVSATDDVGNRAAASRKVAVRR